MGDEPVEWVETRPATTDREVESWPACAATTADTPEERAGIDPIAHPTVEDGFVGVDGVITLALVDDQEETEVGHPTGEDDSAVGDGVDRASPRSADEDAVPAPYSRSTGLPVASEQRTMGGPGEGTAEFGEGQGNARGPRDVDERPIEVPHELFESPGTRREQGVDGTVTGDASLERSEHGPSLGAYGREAEQDAGLACADESEGMVLGLETGEQECESGEGGTKNHQTSMFSALEDREVAEQPLAAAGMVESTEEEVQTCFGAEHVAQAQERVEASAHLPPLSSDARPSTMKRRDVSFEGGFAVDDLIEARSYECDLVVDLDQQRADVGTGPTFASERAPEELEMGLDPRETPCAVWSRGGVETADGGDEEDEAEDPPGAGSVITV